MSNISTDLSQTGTSTTVNGTEWPIPQVSIVTHINEGHLIALDIGLGQDSEKDIEIGQEIADRISEDLGQPITVGDFGPDGFIWLWPAWQRALSAEENWENAVSKATEGRKYPDWF